MNRTDQDRYLLALKAMAENAWGWRRVKVRVPASAPGEYRINGYKDGQHREHIWVPVDPEDPKMPDGSEWR